MSSEIGRLCMWWWRWCYRRRGRYVSPEYAIYVDRRGGLRAPFTGRLFHEAAGDLVLHKHPSIVGLREMRNMPDEWRRGGERDLFWQYDPGDEQ